MIPDALDSVGLAIFVVYVLAWTWQLERDERRTRRQMEEVKRYSVETAKGVVVAREDELLPAFRQALKAPRSLFVHDTSPEPGKPSVFDAKGSPVGWAPRPTRT